MRVRVRTPALAESCATDEARKERFGAAASAVQLLVALVQACRSIDELAAQPPVSIEPAADGRVWIALDTGSHRVGIEATTSQESEVAVVIDRVWADDEGAEHE